jgi:hypothetical protein
VHADGEIQGTSAEQPVRLKRCPAPTPMFTGRDAESNQVEACIVGSANERRVCVVHGLGGTGKTQLALKTIERTRDKWTQVIYLDASSREAIQGALQEFAQANHIGNTHEDAVEWLESRCEQWLLVFDGADDPSTNLHDLFPGGAHGSILITTRLADLTTIAQGPDPVCHLSNMNEEDALALLMRAGRLHAEGLSGGEMEAAMALLQVSLGASACRLSLTSTPGRIWDIWPLQSYMLAHISSIRLG